MAWGSLSKEQKQYAVLGGLVGTIIFYALFAFGLRPFLEGWGETREKYAELKVDLEEGRKNVNRTSTILLNLDSSYTNLTELADQYIAPVENAYSWVTEQIYRHARALELDVESISEYPSNLPWSNTPDVQREFGAYGVRMVTVCGYDTLRELVTQFEESNPLLVVSGVRVTPSVGDYERHRVQVYLEWPIWTNPKGDQIIRSSDLTEAADVEGEAS